MATISIIVPVYNVEKYLRQCLDSIVGQIYTDWECILVDDGSTDNSGGICDEYSNKDSRLVVLHKRNEGVSVARNTGLSLATGKYVAFFDSDDTVASDMLHDLVTIAEERNSDIVQSAGYIRDDDKNGTGVISSMSREMALKENFSFSDRLKPSMCLGIYKRSLFNDVQFPRDIHHYEDFTVITQLVYKSKGVTFTDKRYYYYRQREGSATHSGLTSKRSSCLLIPNYLMEKGVFRNDTDLNNTIGFFIYGQLITTILADDVKESDTEFIKNEIHKNIKRILKAKTLNILMRIYCIFYLFLPSVVTKIIRFRHHV